MTRLPLVALTPFALLAAAAPSQVPAGWYVAATFKTVNNPTPQAPFLGDGGLWFVHPRNPAVPAIAVQGLGSGLTGAGTSGVDQGSNSVAILPDGRLAVGELVPPGNQLHLHLVTLAGNVAVQDQTFFVGTSVGGGGIGQIQVLPGGDLVFSVSGITSAPPLSGAPLGRWSHRTGAIAPIQVTGLSGFVNASTINVSGTTVFLGTFVTPTQGGLWSVPVAGGPATRIVTTLPIPGIMNLDVDNLGRLVVGCFGAPPYSDVYLVNPTTGNVTPMGASPDVRNALRVERATGNLAVQRNLILLAPPRSGLGWMLPTGAETMLSVGPAGGWGGMAGVDIAANPFAFGPESPGASRHAWDLAPAVPRPNGLPLAGNQAFRITLTANPTPAPGLWLASLRPSIPAIPVLGIALNIDPGIVFHGVLPAAPPQDILLPIPDDLSLAGRALFFQAVLREPQGLAASSGLAVTIMAR